MIGFIWVGIIILSVICAFFCSNAPQLINSLFSGAANAVTLCISLCGCICFFSGLMNIAQKSGITSLFTAMLKPILKIAFPGLDIHSKAASAISLNIAANMLGMSNAATPFGLEAMKQLQAQNNSPNTASDSMITFIILNIATVQIVPTTVAVMRSAAGSKAPLEIMPCVWISSISAAVCGVFAANSISAMHRRREKTRRKSLLKGSAAIHE